ncbi:TPA: hypothetical protein I7272_25415 [Vibrio parahaemolyticus]|nr:hypothetical protein [Vibrio parahaemolyticus]EGQ8734242.1 hypothetical protein [Vibrio parahaemolyticus]EGQ8885849.1 hypothetical protein [Vibrio parahaemolyticus]EGQ8916836.1 hypothetical protein [Vibrio parahaemolyticus]EGQ8936583.1 hypothetical protein [Vibrio parahaemolyticus]
MYCVQTLSFTNIGDSASFSVETIEEKKPPQVGGFLFFSILSRPK